MQEEENSTAQKFDGEKIRMELLPPFALTSIADVFTFGAKKYDSWNWSKGLEWNRVYGALQRHLNSWYNREGVDSETKKSHLHHAGCCIMMLIDLEQYRPDLDNRPSHQGKQLNIF